MMKTLSQIEKEGLCLVYYKGTLQGIDVRLSGFVFRHKPGVYYIGGDDGIKAYGVVKSPATWKYECCTSEDFLKLLEIEGLQGSYAYTTTKEILWREENIK